MSKLSPMGQSMAALFTPESDKLRAAKKEKAATAAGNSTGTFRIPGAQEVKESGKSQDSLGNPMSPGYEPLNLKKKKDASEESEAAESKGGAGQVIHTPRMGPQTIRLSLGWDKILLTQKKLCEKAKGLFTLLEGPTNYRSQKKTNFLESKSRGSILDLDSKDAPVNEPKKKEAA